MIWIMHESLEKRNEFKSRILPTKDNIPTLEYKRAPESAPTEPTKHMTFKLKLKDEIVTAKTDIIDQIFWENFNHQAPSCLLEDFLGVKHAKMRN